MIFVTPLITTIKWRQSDLGAEIVLLSIFRAFELVPTARRQLLHPVISKWAELPPRRHLSTYYNQKFPSCKLSLILKFFACYNILEAKKRIREVKKHSRGEFGYSTLPRTGYSWCVLFLKKAQPLSLWHSSNRLGRPPAPPGFTCPNLRNVRSATAHRADRVRKFGGRIAKMHRWSVVQSFALQRQGIRLIHITSMLTLRGSLSSFLEWLQM